MDETILKKNVCEVRWHQETYFLSAEPPPRIIQYHCRQRQEKKTPKYNAS